MQSLSNKKEKRIHSTRQRRKTHSSIDLRQWNQSGIRTRDKQELMIDRRESNRMLNNNLEASSLLLIHVGHRSDLGKDKRGR
jgi:hypothetical protein